MTPKIATTSVYLSEDDAIRRPDTLADVSEPYTLSILTFVWSSTTEGGLALGW